MKKTLYIAIILMTINSFVQAGFWDVFGIGSNLLKAGKSAYGFFGGSSAFSLDSIVDPSIIIELVKNDPHRANEIYHRAIADIRETLGSRQGAVFLTDLIASHDHLPGKFAKDVIETQFTRVLQARHGIFCLSKLTTDYDIIAQSSAKQATTHFPKLFKKEEGQLLLIKLVNYGSGADWQRIFADNFVKIIKKTHGRTLVEQFLLTYPETHHSLSLPVTKNIKFLEESSAGRNIIRLCSIEINLGQIEKPRLKRA